MSSVLNTVVQTGTGYSQQVNSVRDVFSAEIYFSALPVLKFDQFSTKRTELGVQPGKTIQMPKMNNVQRGGRLTEGVRLQTRGMSMSQTSLSVFENGNAIGFSEALLISSFFDQLAAASLLLGRDLAIVLDMQLRDALLATVNTKFAKRRANRAALTAADTFDTQLIKDGVEALETLNAPKWGGDHYICFLHPHQGRGLRDDNDWVNASLYAGATQIYTGEIGRYEDTRFITTTIMPNGANSTVDSTTGDYVDPAFKVALQSGQAGNQTTIYQAVIFGEYSYGHATALPVELRDNGVEDYGREHGLAWYAIYGQDVLETNHSVVLESA